MVVQRPLFAPRVEWRPTPLHKLPSWADAKRVAVDIETKDPLLTKLGPGVRRGGYIVGISFAIEDGPAHYVPMRHEAVEDNLDADKAIQYFKDQAAVFKGDLGGANLQYDLDYLAQEGIVFNPRYFRDVQLAEPLIDELQMSYSLDNIAKRHHIKGKDESVLSLAAHSYGINKKAEMWKLPGRYVGEYAEQDARLPLKLLRIQERIIDEQDLWGIYNLESRVLPILMNMRRRGVKIDFDQLDEVEQWSLQEEEKAWKELHRLTGIQVAVGKGMTVGPLAKALESTGVKVPLTAKTKKPSVTTDFLKGIDNDVSRLIMEARRVSKIRTTFVASIRKHAVNGRIHCTFNQMRATDDSAGDNDRGARYGRLSSCDPNLQQQPARDPVLGPLWRSIYVPDTDLWACCDYSQQEPRWLTHYAEVTKDRSRQLLPLAHKAAEEYRNNPLMDNHEMTAKLCNIPRKAAKEIYLGRCYGMGEAKMCHKLGLPTKWKEIRGVMREVAGDEGKELINKFDSSVPFVKALSYAVSDRAQKMGYIKTIGGRRCRFPLDLTGRNKYDWTHKGLNRLVQGSSADQTKQALVDADDAGFDIQLQVHDELDFSAENEQQAHDLAEIMRNSIKGNVPFRVDVEVGPNWGNLKEISQ